MDEEEHFWIATETQYKALLKVLKRRGLSLPFDAHRLLSPNPLVYDEGHGWGAGSLVGREVWVTEGPITDILGNTEELIEADLGVVVSEAHGRIVVYIEHLESYIGWLNPTDYILIDIDSETGAWIH